MDGFDVGFEFAPEHVGLFLSVGLLKDEKVREFIARVREREGIYCPVDRDELAQNLQEYPPERFIEEATPVAEEAFARGVFDDSLEGIDPDVLVEHMPADASPLLEAFGEMFEEFLQVDDNISTSARVIARHIVTGPLEVPEPLPMSGSAVGKLALGGGASMLIAMIPPFADIEGALGQIRNAFRKHYGRGERSRWPDKFAETLWLRHCAFEFELDPDEEATYRRLASFAMEIWPVPTPEVPESTEEREARLRREMERIRKNNKAFEERKSRGFFGPET